MADPRACPGRDRGPPVTREDGSLRNVATTALGDRVQVRSARIDGGRLLVSAVRAGENDAACCPGDLVEWQWTLGEGRLNALGAVRTGRLSLATLAGTVWILRAWDIIVPAESEPVVTLSYDAGCCTGTGGCNRYFAVVEGGAMPGEVKVEPLGGTRMACPACPESPPRSRHDSSNNPAVRGLSPSCWAGSRSRTRGAMVPGARCCSRRALHPSDQAKEHEERLRLNGRWWGRSCGR
jgi:META domain